MTRSRAAAHRTPTDRRSEPRSDRPVASPASGFVTKGDEVEEWLDLRFFRPIGAQIARRLGPTRVTADQVTLISLLIGLAAGHLFVYTSPALNALGFGLFIVSDLFDSADGQLARLRGTSTRIGRALDGLSDATRFLNLGAHLLVRLALASGWGWPLAATLVVVATVSHSTQSSAIDFIRHAFLAVGVGRGSEIDVDASLDTRQAPWHRRLAIWVYRTYSRRQLSMFPQTVALLRAQSTHGLDDAAVAVYRRQLLPIVGQCAWLGQNLRFVILGVTAVLGWPAGLLWFTVLPMNAVLLWLRVAQERGAGRTLRAAGVPGPKSPASPAVAIASE